jgi:heme/copper-type cytochrome/quinol oxidase subunit 2
MRISSPGACWTAAIALVFALVCLGGSVIADEPANFDVTIKDHRFTPSEIHVPVGKRITLIVKNEDDAPEEFDSSALKVEKVIMGGTYAKIWLRPLGPGRYAFMGEFHPATAQGVVISE